MKAKVKKKKMRHVCFSDWLLWSDRSAPLCTNYGIHWSGCCCGITLTHMSWGVDWWMSMVWCCVQCAWTFSTSLVTFGGTPSSEITGNAWGDSEVYHSTMGISSMPRFLTTTYPQSRRGFVLQHNHLPIVNICSVPVYDGASRTLWAIAGKALESPNCSGKQRLELCMVFDTRSNAFRIYSGRNRNAWRSAGGDEFHGYEGWQDGELVIRL